MQRERERAKLLYCVTNQVDVERTTVNSVYLTAAQRLSVLVTAKNSTDLNYYMHADMDTDMFDTVPANLQPSKTVTREWGKHCSLIGSAIRHHGTDLLRQVAQQLCAVSGCRDGERV